MEDEKAKHSTVNFVIEVKNKKRLIVKMILLLINLYVVVIKEIIIDAMEINVIIFVN